jgi:hypothetical protein
MESLSGLLDSSTDAAVQESLSAIHQVIKAHGEFTAEERRRLQNLETYYIPSHATRDRRRADVEIFGPHITPQRRKTDVGFLPGTSARSSNT